jgi:hypothetical protein
MLAGVLGLAWNGRQRDQEEILQLARFRLDHSARKEAHIRAEKTREYLASWSSWLGPYRGEAQAWLASDRQIMESVDDYKTVSAQASALVNHNEFAEAIALYKGFTASHQCTPEAETAEAQVARLTPILEDYNDYEAIRTSSAHADSATALEETQRKIHVYENNARPKKPMLYALRAWETWFARIQQPRHYYLTVESLAIPPGSDLDALFGTKSRVVVEVNDVVHSTDWFKGNNPSMSARLGPYPFQFGQAASLRVEVEGHHLLLHNDRAERTVSDENFVLGQANGPFPLTCRKGKTVTVNLSCAEAMPPELPPYRAQ